MMASISAHAVMRYQQRVAPVPADEVRARLASASRIIDQAAAFGCDTIILGDGARLKLQGDVVATVLEKRVR